MTIQGGNQTLGSINDAETPTGTLYLQGSGTKTANSAITQSAVQIASGVTLDNNAMLNAAVLNKGTLYTNASNLGGLVGNDHGLVYLEGGSLNQPIRANLVNQALGAGSVTVTADTTVNAFLLAGNTLTINDSVKITNNSNIYVGQLVNNGTIQNDDWIGFYGGTSNLGTVTGTGQILVGYDSSSFAQNLTVD